MSGWPVRVGFSLEGSESAAASSDCLHGSSGMCLWPRRPAVQRWVRGGKPAAALGFSVFWVSFEYLAAMTSIHGTYGNLAYGQMYFLPILQIAVLTGIWGISFCVVLFPARVAEIWLGYGTSYS